MECVNCGRSLRPGVAFCTWCGGVVSAPTAPSHPHPEPPQPAPPHDVPSPSCAGAAPVHGARATRVDWHVPALVVGLVVLTAAVVVGAVALVSRNNTVAAPTPNHHVPGNVVSSLAAPPAYSSQDDGGSSVPPPSTIDQQQPADDASAKIALDDEVARDKEAAEQLVGNWVPQLSSKQPGLVADGITYGYLQIWQNFQQLRQQYPDVLLIWSGNYISYKQPDFYVTIVPQLYSDGAAANQWCGNANIDAADCYAKLLSHSVGPTGTTMPRQ